MTEKLISIKTKEKIKMEYSKCSDCSCSIPMLPEGATNDERLCEHCLSIHKTSALSNDEFMKIIKDSQSISKIIESEAIDSPEIQWTVMGILDVIEENTELRLTTEDTERFGVLLKYFNDEQSRLASSKCLADKIQLDITSEVKMSERLVIVPTSMASVAIEALRNMQRDMDGGLKVTHPHTGEYLCLDDIDTICEALNCGAGVAQEYAAVALSMSHLPRQDIDLLEHCDNYRVLSRDDGFIIKLPRDTSISAHIDGGTPELSSIIDWAVKSGYQQIEFHIEIEPLNNIPWKGTGDANE